LHHQIGAGTTGPLLNKNLARLFFLGNYDDVEDKMPKVAKEIVENIKNNYVKYKEEVETIYTSIKDIADQKEFAITLKSMIGSNPFIAYFFEARKSYISFYDWITKKKQNGKDFLFFDYLEHLL
jgi:hypothetical protein